MNRVLREIWYIHSVIFTSSGLVLYTISLFAITTVNDETWNCFKAGSSMAAAVQCLVSGFELSMRMHIAHLWILLLIVTLPIDLVNTFVSFTWPITITAEKRNSSPSQYLVMLKLIWFPLTILLDINPL